MTETFARARAWIVEAVLENPVAPRPSSGQKARLEDGSADCSFEELGFDSLACMELCIFIECETRIPLTTGDMLRHPTVNGLAEYLGGRLSAPS